MLNLEIGMKYPSAIHITTPTALALLVVEISLNTLTIKEEIVTGKETSLIGKVDNLGTM